MSYAFEIIKHNKAWIYQGQGTEYFFDKSRKLIGSAKTGTPVSMLAYFTERPQISISQIWNEDPRALQQLLARGKNAVMSTVPVIESLLSANKKQLFSGSYKEIGTKVVSTIVDALSQVTERVAPATAVDWGGASPITISMELIFMNEKAPIYKSQIFPLLNMSGFSSIDAVGNLKGPPGYQGMAHGIINMDKILRGEYEGLTSLYIVQSGKPVLELFRILVVESVQLTGSEQLYSTTDNEPAYKWIKANVVFKTACPLPIPAASEAGYSSLGDLLGSRLANNNL